jgi:hypothetical protein
MAVEMPPLIYFVYIRRLKFEEINKEGRRGGFINGNISHC